MMAVNYRQAIAKNIEKYCKLRKMNYSEVARRANIPLGSLQNLLYIKKRQDARISTVHAIAKALKVNIDDLIK